MTTVEKYNRDNRVAGNDWNESATQGSVVDWILEAAILEHLRAVAAIVDDYGESGCLSAYIDAKAGYISFNNEDLEVDEKTPINYHERKEELEDR